jgi:hypothetical protein
MVTQHILSQRSVERQHDTIGRLKQTGPVNHLLVIRLRGREIEQCRHQLTPGRLRSSCDAIGHQ